MSNKPRLPERDTDGKLPSYAWPGGYPVVYLDSHCSLLCADCATQAEDDPDEYPENKPYAFDIYYEGPDEYCAVCNTVIESAYGDPDNPEDE